MSKKKLEVKSVSSFYNPSYPSYADKNPLLFPETRPYPFTHRFIDWAAKGGLAGILMVSGNALTAQTQSDSLYNTFPLEKAGVPYTPVMFGTGMPDRISNEDAKKIIIKAFTDSGITLEENVRLPSKSDVPLTGFSHKDQIGFVFMDYSFRSKSYEGKKGPQKKEQWTFKNLKKKFQNTTEKEYKRYLKDRDIYIENYKRYARDAPRLEFVNSLSELKGKKINRDVFSQIYLTYQLNSFRSTANFKRQIHRDLYTHIEKIFGNSIEAFLLQNRIYVFTRVKEHLPDYSNAIDVEIHKLFSTTSKKEFIKSYLTLVNYVDFNYGMRQFYADKEYLQIKLDIMCSYPLDKWFKNMDSLDDYVDGKFLSMDEVEEIDKNNRKGKQFIAPISFKDNRLIMRGGNNRFPDELKEERAALRKKIKKFSGLMRAVARISNEERTSIREKYNLLKNLNELNEIIDAAVARRSRELNSENYKLESMLDQYDPLSNLSVDEVEAFKIVNLELNDRISKWRKEDQELRRMKTLRYLENEVKTYIKWAQSQMGS